MQPIDKGVRSLEICIAGLGVRLACEDAGLVRELESRYRAFLKPISQPAELVIHRELLQDSSSWANFSPVLSDEVLYFSGDSKASYFDLKNNSGRLGLSSTQPQEETDYALRVIYAFLAFRAGGLLFHAAGIVRRGRAYLFLGESGSGKTTVARLSTEDLILNDDLVLLLPAEIGWQVYATPFWNPTQVKPQAAEAGLVGMFRLVKDKRHFLEALSPAQALAEVIACTPVISTQPQFSTEIIQRCLALLKQFPLTCLHFLPDQSFWTLVDRQHPE